MSTSKDMPSPRAVAEIAGLVVGREPGETVERLHALVDRLNRGEGPGEGDAALVADLRHRYGRELAELEDPEAE